MANMGLKGAYATVRITRLAWIFRRQRRRRAVSALQHRRHLLELPGFLPDQLFVDVVPPEDSC